MAHMANNGRNLAVALALVAGVAVAGSYPLIATRWRVSQRR
jgi:hypothetical protein